MNSWETKTAEITRDVEEPSSRMKVSVTGPSSVLANLRIIVVQGALRRRAAQCACDDYRPRAVFRALTKDTSAAISLLLRPRLGMRNPSFDHVFFTASGSARNFARYSRGSCTSVRLGAPVSPP